MSRKKIDMTHPITTMKLRLSAALDQLACREMSEGGHDVPEEADERFAWLMATHCDSVTEGSGGRFPEDEANVVRFASLFTLYRTEERKILRAFRRNGLYRPETMQYALADLVTRALPYVEEFHANFRWLGDEIRQQKPDPKVAADASDQS